MNERSYWVWLTMVFGAANPRIWQIIRLYLTPDAAYRMLKLRDNRLRLTDKEWQAVMSLDISAAESLIKNAENLGISVICIEERSYPWILKTIYNPPSVLYYKGDIRCMDNRRTATAVGARRISDYGIRAVRHICCGLAQKDIVIISGFAMGTDIAAHMSAVHEGKPTVCVMGCGIDIDYPKENREYREKILGCGGLFLSEFPPGTTPFPATFPVRNRILAALGMCTLVFEASSKSGSLITANLAANNGRPVLVLPPPDIMSSFYGGNAGLLRDGAVPLLGVQDVLSELVQIDGMDIVRLWTDGLDITRFSDAPLPEKKEDAPEEFEIIKEKAAAVRSHKKPKKTPDAKKTAELAMKEASRKKTITAAEKPERDVSQESLKQRFPDITDEQMRILAVIGNDTIHADTIAEKLGTGVEELMSALTDMEIEGMLVSMPGNYYEIP